MAISTGSWNYMQSYPSEKDDVKDMDGRTLQRNDFTRVWIRGMGKKYYYAWSSKNSFFMVTIEPSIKGYCVGFYNKEGQLIRKKMETNQNYSQDWMIREALETQKRTEESWNEALNLANMFIKSFCNDVKLKKWNLKDEQIEKTIPAVSPDMFNVPYNPPPNISTTWTTTATTDTTAQIAGQNFKVFTDSQIPKNEIWMNGSDYHYTNGI